MKWLKIVLVIFILFASISLLLLPKPVSKKNNNLKRITVGSQELSVEIANDPSEITKGLGERDQIGSDGMLFVLSQRIIPTFWMKGMRFALDFVWIDGGRVVDLTENVPAEPGVVDAKLKRYSPDHVVTHVLELDAGEIKKREISVGDSVQM